MLRKRVRLFILSLLFLFSILGTLKVNNIEESKADNDIISWIICRDKDGKLVYNSIKTDIVPYQWRSKSVISSTDIVEDNIYNKLMTLGGYKFGVEGKNPFDLFGFAGLHWGSYIGEWKYNKIDACEDVKEGTTSTDYGQYYKGRFEPQDTYNEIGSSKDIRTKQVNNGVSRTLMMVIRDGFANLIFSISKFFNALTITLIGISFGDVTEFVGFGENFMNTIFKNLYTGIYQPFILFMILITAIWMLYYGIVKRQFRMALQQGIIKTILIFFLAILLFIQPSLQSYPNKIATAGQALMVSAMTSGESEKSDICNLQKTETWKATYDGENNKDFLKKLGEEARSSLGCRMWAEFSFRPWVLGQWGKDYKELQDIKNENERWVGKPKVDIGGKEGNNWALFNLALQTNKYKSLDGEERPLINNIHPDYWRIVDAVANIDYETHVWDYGYSGDVASGNFDDGSPRVGGKPGNVAKFLEEWGEAVKKVADKHNMYASMILAQMGLESGWGKHTAGTSNNIFGIKCYWKEWGCSDPVDTEETYNGNRVKIKASFQKPPCETKECALEMYIRFFTEKAYFKNAANSLTKAKFKDVKDVLTSLQKDVKYATSPTYATDLYNTIIKPYGLQDYDTPDNGRLCIDGSTDSNCTPINRSSSGGSSSSGSSSSGNYVSNAEGIKNGNIYLLKDNKPTEYWDIWSGNSTHRISNAFLGFVIGLIGSIAPLFFALTTAIYSVAINITMSAAPIFLLFGLWPGKGYQIFLSWVSLLLNSILKKILSAVLMCLSIIITSGLTSLMIELGVVKTLIFIIFFSYLLIKNKEMFMSKFANINLGGSMNLESPMKESIDKTKAKTQAVAKTGSQLGIAAAAGAIKGRKAGVGMLKGSKEALRGIMKQKIMQKGGLTRQQYLESEREAKERNGEEPKEVICDSCGTVINTESGDLYYRTKEGEILCQICSQDKDEDDLYLSGGKKQDAEKRKSSCALCGKAFEDNEIIFKYQSYSICSQCNETEKKTIEESNGYTINESSTFKKSKFKELKKKRQEKKQEKEKAREKRKNKKKVEKWIR